jgi:hypothetical protein
LINNKSKTKIFGSISNPSAKRRRGHGRFGMESREREHGVFGVLLNEDQFIWSFNQFTKCSNARMNSRRE